MTRDIATAFAATLFAFFVQACVSRVNVARAIIAFPFVAAAVVVMLRVDDVVEFLNAHGGGEIARSLAVFFGMRLP